MIVANADITLRHLCRRHAEALARAYVTEGPLEIVGWADTQVTALERRLDKTLLLRVARRLCALEVEFAYQYQRDLPERVHDYRGLSRIAFRAERPGRRPPPMQSVVILLTGRRRRWPRERSLSTGWPRCKWSGIHFRIDAVYQRSVAELRARGSPFWLAFTPLARDASAEAMREAVAAIRAEVPDADERSELFAALLVMADVDPWGYALRPMIEALIYEDPVDLITVSKTLRDAYERGQREGREEGIEKGLAEGVQKMLRGLFARRLHRALTARERRALAARAASDPERTQDKALALEGDALAAWLLGPGANKAPAVGPRRKKTRTPTAAGAQARVGARERRRSR
jgi:hypothetical protein